MNGQVAHINGGRPEMSEKNVTPGFDAECGSVVSAVLCWLTQLSPSGTTTRGSRHFSHVFGEGCKYEPYAIGVSVGPDLRPHVDFFNDGRSPFQVALLQIPSKHLPTRRAT